MQIVSIFSSECGLQSHHESAHGMVVQLLGLITADMDTIRKHIYRNTGLRGHINIGYTIIVADGFDGFSCAVQISCTLRIKATPVLSWAENKAKHRIGYFLPDFLNEILSCAIHGSVGFGSIIISSHLRFKGIRTECHGMTGYRLMCIVS